MPVRLSDVIQPEVFAPYMVKRTKEKSAIFESGILRSDANFASFLAGGGRTINVPFWKDLDDSDSNVGNDDPASVLIARKIQAAKDLAVRQVRNDGVSAARLSGILAGSDPMKAVGEMIADYWVREYNKILVATLHGVYLDNVANDSGDMVYDIGTDANSAVTSAEKVSALAIIAAKQTMGDAADDLRVIIMHSVVYSNLQGQNLITFIPNSRGEIMFPTYLGYRVIVSDKAKRVTGTYRTEYITYLIGEGAIAFDEQPMATAPAVEIHREPLQAGGVGVDTLITRRQFIMHPYGVKWTDSVVAGEFPTNTELALAANWDRVYPERKQIPIAFLVTNG